MTFGTTLVYDEAWSSCSLLSSPCTSSLLDPNKCFPQHPILRHLQLVFLFHLLLWWWKEGRRCSTLWRHGRFLRKLCWRSVSWKLNNVFTSSETAVSSWRAQQYGSRSVVRSGTAVENIQNVICKTQRNVSHEMSVHKYKDNIHMRIIRNKSSTKLILNKPHLFIITQHSCISIQFLPLYMCYVVESKSFQPDIQKPRQMENAVRDT